MVYSLLPLRNLRASSARRFLNGRESLPVGRPDFKPGWGRLAVLCGFDSHSLPPFFSRTCAATKMNPPACGDREARMECTLPGKTFYMSATERAPGQDPQLYFF